ncbi:MAG: hypothetical protein KAW41_01815 [Candidatus Diapherotrites archaeon]|nr:hypothetical protein [Candidatus Diapherotrites archaeon]
MKKPELVDIRTRGEAGFLVSRPREKFWFNVKGKRRKLWVDNYLPTRESLKEFGESEFSYLRDFSHVNVMHNNEGIHTIELYFTSEKARNTFQAQAKNLVERYNGEKTTATVEVAAGEHDTLHVLRVELPAANRAILTKFLNIVKTGASKDLPKVINR